LDSARSAEASSSHSSARMVARCSASRESAMSFLAFHHSAFPGRAQFPSVGLWSSKPPTCSRRGPTALRIAREWVWTILLLDSWGTKTKRLALRFPACPWPQSMPLAISASCSRSHCSVKAAVGAPRASFPLRCQPNRACEPPKDHPCQRRDCGRCSGSRPPLFVCPDKPVRMGVRHDGSFQTFTDTSEGVHALT
jgi:hypothetical protein